MRESEYRELLNSKTPEQLVDLIIRQTRENNTLKNEIKEVGVRLMDKEKAFDELEAKAGKMVEHWEKKERPLRLKDFSNDEVVSRYVAGESAYKIAKDLEQKQMTIISRLKRAGVYEGKAHDTKGGK